MNNNFTDFAKLKILNLLSNKRVYELPIYDFINPFVLTKKEINLYIKYLNETFIAPQEFEIKETIGHENIIIVIGNYKENSTAIKNGFILLADENTNPILLNYENISGNIEKKILLTTYNKSGIETKFPEFKQAKIDIDNFIYGIFANFEDTTNKEFSLFKINNFINDYYLSFPIFLFQTFKLNDSFTFQEGDEPIDYKDNVEKAEFFKVEQSFGSDGIFDILLGYNYEQGKTNIYYMCVDLNEHIVKYISTPLGFQILTDPNDLIFNVNNSKNAIASQTSDSDFKGIFIYYNFKTPSIQYLEYYKLESNPDIKYIVLFTNLNIKIMWYLEWISDIVFIDINTIYYIVKTDRRFIGIYKETIEPNNKIGVVINIAIVNNITTQFGLWYDFPQEKLNSLFKIFKKTYSKENRQYIICVKAIIYVMNSSRVFHYYNTSGIIVNGDGSIANTGMIVYARNVLYLCDFATEIQITDIIQNTDYVIALKQQNRINLLTINNALPTLTEPYNLTKTQTNYNYGNINTVPWFAIPYDSDLGNFETVHIQAAQVDTPTQYELIADVNLIDYINTNNNLIYSFKLNQTTMNDLVNNFWFLGTKTGQLIFKKSLSITKNIFEEKTLNFIANIVLYLVDKNRNNIEFSAELFKIFNTKNDKLILENVAIPYIKIFFENGNNKLVNITEFWMTNFATFEMSLNVSLNFKYPTNKPIKYQLLSFNNVVVYEFDILNFTLPNILEISHKFYYN